MEIMIFIDEKKWLLIKYLEAQNKTNDVPSFSQAFWGYKSSASQNG